jgi:hypothetical protein
MLDIFQSTLQNLSDKKSSTSTPEIFHKAYLNMYTSINFKAFFLVVNYNKKPKNDQKKKIIKSIWNGFPRNLHAFNLIIIAKLSLISETSRFFSQCKLCVVKS